MTSSAGDKNDKNREGCGLTPFAHPFISVLDVYSIGVEKMQHYGPSYRGGGGGQASLVQTCSEGCVGENVHNFTGFI